jgi:hypothetical protein
VKESANGNTGRSAATVSNGGGPAPIIPADHGRSKRGPAADMRAKRERGSRPARKRAGS